MKNMWIVFWFPVFLVACSSTPSTEKDQDRSPEVTQPQEKHGPMTPTEKRNQEDTQTNAKQDKYLQSQTKRALHFLKRSGCNFVEKTEKELAPDALWNKNYYSEKKRLYLRLFVFPNQKKAIKHAAGFMKQIHEQEKATQGTSRIELIHSWGVNGPILFIIRGDDQREINHLLSHFSGEE